MAESELKRLKAVLQGQKYAVEDAETKLSCCSERVKDLLLPDGTAGTIVEKAFDQRGLTQYIEEIRPIFESLHGRYGLIQCHGCVFKFRDRPVQREQGTFRVLDGSGNDYKRLWKPEGPRRDLEYRDWVKRGELDGKALARFILEADLSEVVAYLYALTNRLTTLTNNRYSKVSEGTAEASDA